ncbi:MAG TPA: type II toxin-antitoxin system RelE/ParE family toxin [Candidatus Deferrimicrobiaceae bacterium]
MKLRFTPSAKTELLSAAKYINNDNPDAAINFLKKTDELLKRLEKHPLSGRIIPEYPELPYRELLVLPYRFFYSVQNQTIWIVAVWHTAQLPKEPNKNVKGV